MIYYFFIASFSWKIEKYARMINVWAKEQKPNIHVIIHFDQMFILSENTILDNFNLKHIRKGYLKHKTLIIAHEHEVIYTFLCLYFL